MTEFCPYCYLPCKKVGDKWICPKDGIVLQEVEKEEEEDKERSYLG